MRFIEDHFAALDLPRRPCSARELTAQFRRVRARALRRLEDPAQYEAARRELDAVHRAYNALRDARGQAEHLAALRSAAAALAAGPADARYRWMRGYIASCLEDNLLRCSRRQAVLREGRRLGFSDFHTHLMIAQVQFGDESLMRAMDPRRRPSGQRLARVAARFTAAGVLGLALFLAMVRWLGV